MTQKRIQLSLFIDPNRSEAIEAIREKYNPLQYALIKSHVTLCREDELTALEAVFDNLKNLNSAVLSIDFGPVIRFSEGAGVLIPAIGPNDAFQQLRVKVLQGIVNSPRLHEPHITLIHPRNGTCTDEIFETIQQVSLPDQLTFNKISLIEQEIGKEWKVLREFGLG